MLLGRENRPDHIVIETSGLALPQPLVRAFNWPGIGTRVTVDSVVTVVDGRAVTDGQFAHNLAAVDLQRSKDDNLDHETPLSELFDDQIACADMIIVNKSDLLDEAEAERFVEARPDAPLVTLEGIGHYPMVEAPARFADAVLGLLDEGLVR